MAEASLEKQLQERMRSIELKQRQAQAKNRQAAFRNSVSSSTFKADSIANRYYKEKMNDFQGDDTAGAPLYNLQGINEGVNIPTSQEEKRQKELAHAQKMYQNRVKDQLKSKNFVRPIETLNDLYELDQDIQNREEDIPEAQVQAQTFLTQQFAQNLNENTNARLVAKRVIGDLNRAKQKIDKVIDAFRAGKRFITIVLNTSSFADLGEAGGMGLGAGSVSSYWSLYRTLFEDEKTKRKNDKVIFVPAAGSWRDGSAILTIFDGIFRFFWLSGLFVLSQAMLVLIILMLLPYVAGPVIAFDLLGTAFDDISILPLLSTE